MAADNAPAKRSRDEANISQESAAKRPRYNYDDMIVVLVGPGENRFTVHKEVICAKSKFFKAACTDRWLEGHQKTVRLPEVEVEVFQRYVDWIYTNDLAEDDLPQSHRPCIKLYLLGTYLNDVHFQNKAMELLFKVHEKLKNIAPNCYTVWLIWENTTPNSLLRKWFVDNLTQRASSECFENSYADLPRECIHQLLVKLSEMLKQQAQVYTKLKASDYFEVENTE